MVFIVWARTSMLDSAWGGPSRPATPPVPLRSGAASLALRALSLRLAMNRHRREMIPLRKLQDKRLKFLSRQDRQLLPHAHARTITIKRSSSFRESLMTIQNSKVSNAGAYERQRNRDGNAGVISLSADQHAG